MEATQLMTLLESLGINRLRFSMGQTEILGCCPIHGESRPSFGVSTEKLIFNCFAAGTRVITKDGNKNIEDLAGKTAVILTENGKWVEALFKKYPDSLLKKLTLSRNGRKKEIYTTANHLWFSIPQGSSDIVTKKTTIDLKSKERLCSVFPKKRNSWKLDLEGILHGLVFGDGTRNNQHGRVNLFGNKQSLSTLFKKSKYNVCHHKKYRYGQQFSYISGQIGYMKELPSLDSNEEYLLGFLAGYLATDGCVSENGDISLSSATIRNLEFIRDVSQRLGIGNFGIGFQERSGYRKHKTKVYKISFIASTLDKAMFLRKDHRERFVRKKRVYERLRWQVVSVEDTDLIEPVYCAEVPNTHSFALEDNILTSNCFSCHASGSLMLLVSRVKKLTPAAAHAYILKFGSYNVEAKDTDIDYIFNSDDVERTPLAEVSISNYAPYIVPKRVCQAREYLQKRGIKYRKSGFLTKTYHEIGFDPKQHRVLFPWYTDDKFYGCMGRLNFDLPNTQKYMAYFGLHKGSHLFYGHMKWQEKQVKAYVICEGEIDSISVSQLYDYHGMVAFGLGTARATHAQVSLLKRIGGPYIVALDSDAQGREGSESLIKILKRSCDVRAIEWPEKDAGECTDKQIVNVLTENNWTGLKITSCI